MALAQTLPTVNESGQPMKASSQAASATGKAPRDTRPGSSVPLETADRPLQGVPYESGHQEDVRHQENDIGSVDGRNDEAAPTAGGWGEGQAGEGQQGQQWGDEGQPFASRVKKKSAAREDESRAPGQAGKGDSRG